jgi:hypothetical protein
MKTTFEIFRSPEWDMFYTCHPTEGESDVEFDLRKQSMKGLFSTVWEIVDTTTDLVETSIRSSLYTEEQRQVELEKAMRVVGEVIAQHLINNYFPETH